MCSLSDRYNSRFCVNLSLRRRHCCRCGEGWVELSLSEKKKKKKRRKQKKEKGKETASMEAGGGRGGGDGDGDWREEIRFLHGLLATEEEDTRERSAFQTAAGRAMWSHVVGDPLAEVLAGESFLHTFRLKMENHRRLQTLKQKEKDQEIQIQIQIQNENNENNGKKEKEGIEGGEGLAAAADAASGTLACHSGGATSASHETAGVMLAIRTLWFDAKLEAALQTSSPPPLHNRQVVILGAGMDARAYRLACLEGCSVFEIDLPKVLDLKCALLKAIESSSTCPATCALRAKHVTRIATDISKGDWFTKLREAGYDQGTQTVWILEGFLYYLQDEHAKDVLRCIAKHSLPGTLVLADLMNEHSTHLGQELHVGFFFHSDWPEELLPTLGYTQIHLSQIGDPDANFGLIQDPDSLFNRLRRTPRYAKCDQDGKPCRRLFLVQCKVL